ncbi:peptide transporter ptr2 [Actinomortierella ambigua]|uniref:Peptide transporter ptr2 n=1 Tax=Actinomortierella ambigua TaxID=1343610 RepID=A0A9P6QN15_9FUNG|nr:peptide transporter ptr2 [Actinomortierella ambigua]
MKGEYNEQAPAFPVAEMAYNSDPMMSEFNMERKGVDEAPCSLKEDLSVRGPDEPTEEELHTLRKISDKIPVAAWLIVVVELCERFAYYGLSAPFQNYISNPYSEPPSDHPGAIGAGQQTASALNYFFQFFCYFTPVIGAMVADQYWGKFKAILVFAVIYMVGLLVLVLTSIPPAIEANAALPGLVIAMIIIGLGTGGIKANVSPMVAEQYTETKARVKTLPSGERVIVDPDVTVQSIFLAFYFCINVGSLSAIITTNIEKYIGFWLAYLIPLVVFLLAVACLLYGKDKFVKTPPRGSVLIECFRIIKIATKNGWSLDAAKPSSIYGRNPEAPIVTWDDIFIEELKIAFEACKIFCFFPFYWVIYGQLTTNLVSQAGTMLTDPLPNDIINNIDPISLIILIPIFDKFIYPFLRRYGYEPKPVTRIALGFLFTALSMAWAALVQHLIYTTGPNYDHPLSDPAQTPNNITVAWQVPSYVFMALSEIMASVTGLEFAFTNAPVSMKSVVMSIFLFTNCLGALLNFALLPLVVDPLILINYSLLAVISFIISLIILFFYRNMDVQLHASRAKLQVLYDQHQRDH